MSRMTRDQAQAQLAGDVRADLAAVGAMLELLDRQFAAALHHKSAELAALTAELAPALDAMEARRVRRLSLVRALHGPAAAMADLIAALPPTAQTALAADWAELERRVRACKEATARNTALMTEQFSVMQRVLHGEEQIYAPR
ncbi:flagellar protein FlgN [Massilia agilis]|uniref:Flagellar protein FlgN n=1 Tax=Massilia agilis TaxID=1811226 RepID=A0ABT2DDG9_9BURK|nr:flagellar protein FlgN [Massilia agilis]MCS0808909.1 flagellar protein FlgN [Massilia agilis]